jgi:hypothetical protein
MIVSDRKPISHGSLVMGEEEEEEIEEKEERSSVIPA